jgi:hypothetical protein
VAAASCARTAPPATKADARSTAGPTAGPAPAR